MTTSRLGVELSLQASFFESGDHATPKQSVASVKLGAPPDEAYTENLGCTKAWSTSSQSVTATRAPSGEIVDHSPSARMRLPLPSALAITIRAFPGCTSEPVVPVTRSVVAAVVDSAPAGRVIGVTPL